MLQASDHELAQGLRARRILILNSSSIIYRFRFRTLGNYFADELRPISISYLTAILEFLLNALVANSLSHQAAPAEDLVWTLEHEHEVKADVTRQVMTWFGQVSEGLWSVDVDATVKEVGLGILRAYRVSTKSRCRHD
jgi:sister chromatid cohesion protein DCC1